MRLLADTCAAMKLLSFGDKLFKAGTLKAGDLVIHPRVFTETKKWPKYKKEKYKKELQLLLTIRSTPGLNPPSPNTASLIKTTILATESALGLSISAADREQLASAIHCAAAIVTNDQPFTDTAEALSVQIYSAEKIVLEAYVQGALTKQEVKQARTKWEKNNEKAASDEDEDELSKI